jgi:hypothetical protein
MIVIPSNHLIHVSKSGIMALAIALIGCSPAKQESTKHNVEPKADESMLKSVPSISGTAVPSWTLIQKSGRDVDLPDTIGMYDLGFPASSIIGRDEASVRPDGGGDDGSITFPRLPGEVIRAKSTIEWNGYTGTSRTYVSSRPSRNVWASITELSSHGVKLDDAERAGSHRAFSENEIIRHVTSAMGTPSATYRGADKTIRFVYSRQPSDTDPYKVEKTLMCSVEQICTRPWMPSCSDTKAIFTTRFSVIDAGRYGAIAITADPSKLREFPIKKQPLNRACIIPKFSDPFAVR